MTPRAILLDLDDTLIDTRTGTDLAIRDLYSSHGRLLGCTAEEAVARWLLGLKIHFPLYERGEITFQGQRRGRVRTLCNRPDMPDDEADGWFQAYLECSARHYVLFDDVVPFLDRAKGKGLPMAIVTNGHPDVQMTKVRKTGLEGWIRTVLVSEAVGFRKPRKEIFLMAASAMGVSPEDCLMIGDRYDADYLGAQGAGMRALLMARETPGPGGDTRTIPSLNRVLASSTDVGTDWSTGAGN